MGKTDQRWKFVSYLAEGKSFFRILKLPFFRFFLFRLTPILYLETPHAKQPGKTANIISTSQPIWFVLPSKMRARVMV
jgi:hypothetical protein